MEGGEEEGLGKLESIEKRQSETDNEGERKREMKQLEERGKRKDVGTKECARG